MKNYFPPKNQNYKYLQTNRSDDLGSIWSSFNLDFQQNLGSIRLSNKLVQNTTSSDDVKLGVPSAFEFFYGVWWAICNNYIFVSSSSVCASSFTIDTSPYAVGSATTQFDITNPSGTTFRYTWDNTGTNPGITAGTFPIGASVYIWADNFNAGNTGNFTVTGSGNKYFEITNAAGVAENDKTIGTSGYISVYGGTIGTTYNTFISDLTIFNERIWSTTEITLYSKDRNYAATGGIGNWTPRDTLNSSTVHKMTYFKKQNRLYYVDNINTISSINTLDIVSNTPGDYFLDLDNYNLRITTIESGSQSIWVGTKRVDGTTNPGTLAAGTKCCIYQWDGISAQPTQEYKIDSADILSICLLNDIPYAIDTDGRILKYTGYSFEEQVRFPIYNILPKNVTNTSPDTNFVHFNGMIPTKNNTILVAANNNNSNNKITENLPSGIWEYDLATNNFTHKHSITLNTIDSATTIDFGQNIILNIGALKINELGVGGSGGRSTLFLGASYYTTATVTKSAILIDSQYGATTPVEGQKRGYVIPTWFNSDEIQDRWARIWVVFKRFLSSTDKIIFKYRLNEEDPIYVTITWASTTSFTTTTDVSAYAPTVSPFNGTTGGEVEVIQGSGSGSCTHITSIINNAGTYTVTLDTAITGVTGTAKARFQKWIKAFPEVTGQVLSYGQISISDVSNTRIQLKCVMEFTGDDEFMKLALVSNEDIKINL